MKQHDGKYLFFCPSPNCCACVKYCVSNQQKDIRYEYDLNRFFCVVTFCCLYHVLMYYYYMMMMYISRVIQYHTIIQKGFRLGCEDLGNTKYSDIVFHGISCLCIVEKYSKTLYRKIAHLFHTNINDFLQLHTATTIVCGTHSMNSRMANYLQFRNIISLIAFVSAPSHRCITTV